MDTIFDDKRRSIEGVKMYVYPGPIWQQSDLIDSQMCEDGVIDGSGFYNCNKVGQYLYFVQGPDHTG